MIAYIPVIVALIGLLMWTLCTNPQLKDMGRGAFFIGLFVIVFNAGRDMVKIIG